MEKCLVFDIFGDYAFFKKFYTTSSPLSYEIPPKTSLTGVIGAILGLSYDARYELFKGKIGLRILNPISKLYLGINWMNTKARNAKNFPEDAKNFLQYLNLPPKAEIASFLGMSWLGQSPHTQANLELVKNPKYRIYYHEMNPYYSDLVKRIKSHTSNYTPFLGSSEFICNFEFIGIYDINKVENSMKLKEISTVVPSSCIDLREKQFIDFKHSNLYKINVPFNMIPGRIVEEYIDLLYNPLGKSMNMVLNTYYELINKEQKVIENIVLF